MTIDNSDDESLIREFEALAARAQLHVPEDRRDGLLTGFRDVRRMIDLLRREVQPGLEPATTFDVVRTGRTR
jgi:hypothetical protein